MNQKKAKFNIVDIIVILVLIAGIAFVGIRMFGGQEPAANSAADNIYHVTFYAECVPEAVANTLVADTKAQNDSRNMDLGTLVDFTIGESVVYTSGNEGKMEQSVKPGYVSVTLVCELTGTVQPTGLQVGKYWLNIGHTLGVCCGMTEIEAIVLDIAAAK